MSLEEWDRTLLGMSREEYKSKFRQARRREALQEIADAAGGFALLVLVGAFCWLCMACSGYHWE